MTTFYRYPVVDNGIKIPTPPVVMTEEQYETLTANYDIEEAEDEDGKYGLVRVKGTTLPAIGYVVD